LRSAVAAEVERIQPASEGSDLALVVEMVIGADGAVKSSDIYRARVRNRAKLAYRGHASAGLDVGAFPGNL
jgi:hypothetical protein